MPEKNTVHVVLADPRETMHEPVIGVTNTTEHALKLAFDYYEQHNKHYPDPPLVNYAVFRTWMSIDMDTKILLPVAALEFVMPLIYRVEVHD